MQNGSKKEPKKRERSRRILSIGPQRAGLGSLACSTLACRSGLSVQPHHPVGGGGGRPQRRAGAVQRRRSAGRCPRAVSDSRCPRATDRFAAVLLAGPAGGWAAAHLGVFRRHVCAMRLSVTDTSSVCSFPGGERAGGRAHVPRTERGGARGDGLIREPVSCPTHTSVAADATMRLLHHRGGAPPGAIGGWVRSVSGRGERDAERGHVEIAVSAGRSERPMTAAPVTSDWR